MAIPTLYGHLRPLAAAVIIASGLGVGLALGYPRRVSGERLGLGPTFGLIIVMTGVVYLVFISA